MQTWFLPLTAWSPVVLRGPPSERLRGWNCGDLRRWGESRCGGWRSCRDLRMSASTADFCSHGFDPGAQAGCPATPPLFLGLSSCASSHLSTAPIGSHPASRDLGTHLSSFLTSWVMSTCLDCMCPSCSTCSLNLICPSIPGIPRIHPLPSSHQERVPRNPILS